MTAGRTAADTVATVLLLLAQVYAGVIVLVFFWDDLPKYVNSILMLVWPVLLGAAMGKLGEKLWPAFSERTGMFMIHLVAGVTLWLPTLFPGLYVVKDYFQLIGTEAARSASVHEVGRLRKAGYLTVPDGRLRPEYHYHHVTISRVKSGDSYNTVKHHHLVTPIVPPNWDPGLKVNVWAVGDESGTVLLTGKKGVEIKGLAVRDPYEISDYRDAVRKAAEKFDLIPGENLYFLKLTKESYEELLSRTRFWTMVSLVVVTLVYTVPLVLLGRGRYKRESAGGTARTT